METDMRVGHNPDPARGPINQPFEKDSSAYSSIRRVDPMPAMWAILLCLTYVLFARPSSAQVKPSVAELMARIEGPQVPNQQGYDPYTIDEMMKMARVPGVSVAVIQDFAIHWAKGYGFADAKTESSVTTDTRFQAASISKPVTALAFLRMVQDGQVRLDDDVNEYLKSWKVPVNEFTRDRPVTARELLSHTSGTGDGWGVPEFEPGEPLPTLVQILDGHTYRGRIFWERPPLTAFKYSGGGYVIIQLLMMDVLGRPFEAIMRDSVLAPLRMSRSTFEQPLTAEFESKAARAHPGGHREDAPWRVEPAQSAAGLWTTPTDLARFAIEVQKSFRGDPGSILPSRLAREMLSPVGLGPHGLGPMVEKRGEGWYFKHSGGNTGFTCDLIAHFVKGYGVVVMTNSDSAGARTLIREIEARVAAAYGWDSLDKEIPQGPFPQSSIPR
jgi:CubicO group peptidase (beta-lactamase class C family)